jgi:large repetitive protein
MVEHPARRDDDGFTLIELVITMVIVGIVMTAIVGALVVMLRTDAGATARLDETRGTQQLTTYFATDVQSTGYGSDTTTPTTASVCTVSAPTPNANAVQMTWTEVIPNGTSSTYYVSYRYEPLGTDWVLVRYACKAGALAPTRIVVARSLAAPPVGWTGTSTPTAVAATSTSTSITLQMTTKSGYRYSVTGTRLTPPAAPTGCTTSPTVNPSSVTFPGASPAALPQTVAVSAPLVGNCAGTVNLSVFTGVSTVTTTMSSTNPAVANLSGGSWTSGQKLIELSIAGTPIGTATLNIVGCELTVVATPSSQTLAGTVLSTAITVTATPAVPARCTSPMTLLYTATASGTETSLPMAGPGIGPWTVTIPTGTTFDDGPAQLSVRQSGADSTLYSTIVNLAPGSPACTLTLPSVSQSAIALQAGNVLPTGVSVNVTSNGYCGTPMVRYTAGSTTYTVAMTGGSSPSFALTLPTTQVWSPGTAMFTFLDSAANPPLNQPVTATATLTGSSACVMGARSVSPNPVTLLAGNVMPSSVVATLATNGLCGTPTVSYTAGSTPYTVSMTTGSSPTYNYTLPTTQAWSAGLATFTFKDSLGANPVTTTLTVNPYVPPACTMSSPSVSSPSIQLQPGNTLPSSISVTVTTNGYCGTPKVNYTAGSTPYSVSMTTGASPTFSYTLPTTQTWAPGTATFTFKNSSGGDPSNGVTTVTTTLLASCSVTSVVFKQPTTATSTIAVNGSGKLSAKVNIEVAVNNTALCSGLTISILPTIEHGDPPLTLNAGLFTGSVASGDTWGKEVKSYSVMLSGYTLTSGLLGWT